MNGKLDRPGGALHFEVIDATPPWLGEAPLIVFYHGIGATADIWAEWLPALVDRFRIARFDTLGFGRSAVPGPGYAWSLDGLVEDVLAVARAAGGGPFHFVGESLGGTSSGAGSSEPRPRRRPTRSSTSRICSSAPISRRIWGESACRPSCSRPRGAPLCRSR